MNSALPSIQALHHLYCQRTGQSLTLRFDRERMWFEFLRAGFSSEDLLRVIAYLQREIRAGRRNVGALKLSNLLQLDRFEEDLAITQIKLRPNPPPRTSEATTQLPASLDPKEDRLARLRALETLRAFKQSIS